MAGGQEYQPPRAASEPNLYITVFSLPGVARRQIQDTLPNDTLRALAVSSQHHVQRVHLSAGRRTNKACPAEAGQLSLATRGGQERVRLRTPACEPFSNRKPVRPDGAAVWKPSETTWQVRTVCDTWVCTEAGAVERVQSPRNFDGKSWNVRAPIRHFRSWECVSGQNARWPNGVSRRVRELATGFQIGTIKTGKAGRRDLGFETVR